MVYVELLMAGVLGGFLAGLLGIGGGFVVVPVLILLLPAVGIEGDLVPKVAVATSLAAMIPTALSAVLAQHRRRNLDLAWVRRLAPGAALGAAVGSLLAASLSGPWLALIFALYTGYFALKMLRTRPQAAEPGRVARCVRTLPVRLVGALIGGFSAVAGVGGACLTVPFLLCSAVEMKRAVAVSSAVGLTIAVAGCAGFASASVSDAAAAGTWLVGLVHAPAALLLAATACVCAPLGVAASQRLPVAHLKRAFGAVVLVACAATLVRQFGADMDLAYAVATAANVLR